jgi:lysozyme family protein
MKDIETIINKIIENEGGFVNHPLDKGGATNFGVTLRTLSKWRGYTCTINDVSMLKISEAKEIYLSEYYYAPRIDSLHKDMQYLVCDTAVNCGNNRAIKILQYTVNNLNKFDIKCDGQIGNITVNALNQAIKKHSVRRVIFEYCQNRINFYLKIVEKNPNQKTFLKGWINRVVKFL